MEPKIKAIQVKPGMLIARQDSAEDSLLLILSINKWERITISYLTCRDVYYGRLDCSLDADEMVTVINGEQKANYLIKLIHNLYRKKFDNQNDIDMVQLIQTLSKKE